MTDKRIVLTTAGSEEEAQRIALALVDARLAACVNIVPHIESVYRWQGEIESSKEWLLIIKTATQRVSAIREQIKELHSYELPEHIVLNVEDGSPEYLAWLEESIREV